MAVRVSKISSVAQYKVGRFACSRALAVLVGVGQTGLELAHFAIDMLPSWHRTLIEENDLDKRGNFFIKI